MSISSFGPGSSRRRGTGNGFGVFRIREIRAKEVHGGHFVAGDVGLAPLSAESGGIAGNEHGLGGVDAVAPLLFAVGALPDPIDTEGNHDEEGGEGKGQESTEMGTGGGCGGGQGGILIQGGGRIWRRGDGHDEDCAPGTGRVNRKADGKMAPPGLIVTGAAS